MLDTKTFALSPVHRAALAIAAAVIGIILYIQADQEGLSETPWLAGVLVILALIFAATWGWRSNAIASPISKRSLDVQETYDAARSTFTHAFKGEIAKNSPNAKLLGPDAQHYIESVAVKAAYMASLLVMEQREKGFSQSPRYNELLRVAGGEHIHALHLDAKHGQKLEGFTRQEALKQSAKEIAECFQEVVAAVANFTHNHPFPMDPIYNRIEAELPFAFAGNAAMRESVYGPMFRAFNEKLA